MFKCSLETERLILRNWKKSDFKDLYEYAKSDLVGPSAGWKPHKSIQESKNIIKLFMREKHNYAIVLKKENKVIGSITLHNRNPQKSYTNPNQKEIGYALNPNYWGNGFMPEAVNCLLDFGFNKLNLNLIWCGHYDFNNNSKRVNEKCGFKYEFTKQQNVELLDNKIFTALYYSISKDEYLKNNLNLI